MSETTLNSGFGATVVGVIGILLYLGVGFIYLTSGLVVPFPWLIVLWAAWVIGVFPLIRFFQTRRMWTPLVPAGAIVFWWVYLSLGEAVFGWAP